MGFLGTMPPVSAQPTLTANDTDPVMTPGTILLYRDSNGNLSMMQYVRADNATVRQHKVVICASNTKSYDVREGRNADAGTPGVFRGIAAGTIATAKYGWAYVGGFCPDADFLTSVSTNDKLRISASGGKLDFYDFNATLAHEATAQYAVAYARDSASDTTGSIQIYGLYM